MIFQISYSRYFEFLQINVDAEKACKDPAIELILITNVAVIRISILK